MRKLIFAATLAALTVQITPVLADPPPWAHANRDHSRGDRGWDRHDDDDRGNWQRRGPVYRERVLRRDDRVWRGNDGRYHCRRSDGTTGLIVGAAAGGLLGNSLAGRGDRTLGTIIGMAGGAALGSSLDRGRLRCR
jgi:hypothetical protein